MKGLSMFQTSLEEDVFGPTLGERADRKKRLLYETLKKAKQAKLLTIGSASGSAVKSVGKSLFKNIATFGIKAIIFNFLYSVCTFICIIVTIWPATFFSLEIY